MHVFTFAGGEAGIRDKLGLQTDGTSSGQEHVIASGATCVRAGKVAGITVTPECCGLSPLVADALATRPCRTILDRVPL